MPAVAPTCRLLPARTGGGYHTAIDKYMYITVNKRFDDTIRVSYNNTEIVSSVDDIQHPIVREP